MIGLTVIALMISAPPGPESERIAFPLERREIRKEAPKPPKLDIIDLRDPFVRHASSGRPRPTSGSPLFPDLRDPFIGNRSTRAKAFAGHLPGDILDPFSRPGAGKRSCIDAGSTRDGVSIQKPRSSAVTHACRTVVPNDLIDPFPQAPDKR